LGYLGEQQGLGSYSFTEVITGEECKAKEMKLKRQQTTIIEHFNMLPKVDTTADFAPHPPQEIHLIITVGATRKYNNPIKSNQVKKNRQLQEVIFELFTFPPTAKYIHFLTVLLCSYDMKFVKSQHAYQHTPISKNVVGENGDWQLSNGNCTTEGTVVSMFGMQKQ